MFLSLSRLHVHTLLNHPPQIMRQLPLSINEKLYKNSSNETVFELTKSEYQETLRKNGYKSLLKYKPKNTHKKEKLIQKYYMVQSTNQQKCHDNRSKNTLRLLDKHFPKSNQVFNRNKVKVNYSCMENVGQIIKRHNR